MVTQAPAPQPLSQYDQHLLIDYISVRFNLIELSGVTKGCILILKDWALQPHIQHHIRQYRELETLQHEVETSDARSAGIRELFALLARSEDPIERRRAAQTLIRVGCHIPNPTPRTPSNKPTPQPTDAGTPAPAQATADPAYATIASSPPAPASITNVPPTTLPLSEVSHQSYESYPPYGSYSPADPNDADPTLDETLEEDADADQDEDLDETPDTNTPAPQLTGWPFTQPNPSTANFFSTPVSASPTADSS